jgi:predicted transcriptional regulator
MANLTLKVDDLLLEKARRLAVRRNTSINAIVKEKLEEFVSTDLNREAALKGIEAFFDRSRARMGNKTWNPGVAGLFPGSDEKVETPISIDDALE